MPDALSTRAASCCPSLDSIGEAGEDERQQDEGRAQAKRITQGDSLQGASATRSREVTLPAQQSEAVQNSARLDSGSVQALTSQVVTADTATLNSENVVTIVLVTLVLLFFAAKKILEFSFNTIISSPDGRHPGEYGKAVAATAILRFATILITVGASLALALGFYKAFAQAAQLVLPERQFGLIVLISYCALVSALSAIMSQLRDGVKRLLSPSPRDTGQSETTEPGK